MEKLIIDRTKWLRGEGTDDSYLLRASDGKQCCLGFDMIRRGYTPEQITSLGTPAQLNTTLPGLTKANPTAPAFTVTGICETLMQLNDSGIKGAPYSDEDVWENSDILDLADESDREHRIAAQFAEIGIEVEFTG